MNQKKGKNRLTTVFGKKGKAMRRIGFLIGIACILVVFVGTALARDVYVPGYYRGNGTYVRPHYRSAPDGNRWNNYGPSTNSRQLMNPRSRDYDRDGVPNYLDRDSDNDGTSDNYDSNPYGRSPFGN